jgi:phosphoenolpyruvate synthase/pyruvate phosphate dikinase
LRAAAPKASAQENVATPLVSLDEPAALDPAIVGRKAAALAGGRQRGLPVLPGLVVTVAWGQAAVELGLETLSGAGPGRARMAVDRLAIDPALESGLGPAADLGDRLVVRSSSAFDDDGRWSGAFASYGDVRHDELWTAIRGCWSSLFSRDSLARFEATSVDVRDAGLAVLIQPQLDAIVGGWARVLADGAAEIAAVAGPPGPLLAGVVIGRRGSVGPDGEITGDLLALPVDAADLRRLLAVCGRTRAELGADRIEWAMADGRVWLFQLDRTEEQPAAARSGDSPWSAGSGAQVYRGVPASPSRAFGRLVRVRPEEADDMGSLPSVAGAILVVDDPLPLFAPLLWQAAGLIALRGNPAGHLCQVARSLHVPAVVGLESVAGRVEIDSSDSWRTVALDGDTGEVWIDSVRSPSSRRRP